MRGGRRCAVDESSKVLEVRGCGRLKVWVGLRSWWCSLGGDRLTVPLVVVGGGSASGAGERFVVVMGGRFVVVMGGRFVVWSVEDSWWSSTL